MDFSQWNIVWALSFGVMAAAVVFGNIVTIKIFLNRQLRKRAHFLLISLAVADLLVGLLSIPLYMTLQYVYDDYEKDHVVVSISEWMEYVYWFYIHLHNCCHIIGANVRYWLAFPSPSIDQ